VLLGLSGHGTAAVYADYAQWEADFLEQERQAAHRARADRPAKPVRPRAAAAAKKFTYRNSARDGMEAAILTAEGRLAECQAALNDPAVASDGDELSRRLAAAQEAEAAVEALYARWAELGAKVEEAE